MINIDNFEKYPASGLSYGGHGGSKKGIIIDGEKWFLKYPKSTKSMEVKGISYTTTPLSEYLGSNIYDLIGIPAHETRLGVYDNKLVVACKDFLKNDEIILDYNMIKNNYDEKLELTLSSSFISDNDIDELCMIMDNNIYFKENPLLKERFWDMFVIDALISNNDRNEGNWGLIFNRRTGNTRLALVFDNGAAFYNKTGREKFEEYLINDFKFMQVAYDSSISIFSQNEKTINPLKYIESMKNNDCNEAIKRIVPRINLQKIEKFFEDIPEEYQGIIIMSKNQKGFYLKVLKYRYDNILKSVYDKLN